MPGYPRRCRNLLGPTPTGKCLRGEKNILLGPAVGQYKGPRSCPLGARATPRCGVSVHLVGRILPGFGRKDPSRVQCASSVLPKGTGEHGKARRWGRRWHRPAAKVPAARCPRPGPRPPPPPPTRPPAHGPAPRPQPPRPRARSDISSHLVPFPFLRGPAPGALPPPPAPAAPGPPPRRAPSPSPAHLPGGRSRRRLPPGGPATKATAAAAAAASRPRPCRRRAAPEPREGPRRPGPPARRPRALTERPGRGPGPREETPRAPAPLSQRHPCRLSGFPCARPLGRERGGHVVGGGGSGRELRVLGGEGRSAADVSGPRRRRETAPAPAPDPPPGAVSGRTARHSPPGGVLDPARGSLWPASGAVPSALPVSPAVVGFPCAVGALGGPEAGRA
ncbi:basic proline-rich protein-like [Acinonyx jubatus]|uniref:Basic proline-rich protein-like n=1 Tax=Acinonyx jubatus TaxID=32536 RepID=A0ABM3P0D7_ACIJB|nr:basic proline-rich protein-like [Acinonyx jubatus]